MLKYLRRLKFSNLLPAIVLIRSKDLLRQNSLNPSLQGRQRSCYTVRSHTSGKSLVEDARVFALTMRQNLEDLARDLSTRLEGAGELLRNFAILALGKSFSPPMHNYSGQVPHECKLLLALNLQGP